MKVLTLHQPWASLVALGVKTIETRSWSTQYRGPLAIHAGAKAVYGAVGEYRAETWFSDVQHVTDRCYCDDGEVGPPCDQRATRTPCLTRAGAEPIMVPLGAIVATCTLVDVVPIRMVAPWDELPMPCIANGPTGMDRQRGTGADRLRHLWMVDGLLHSTDVTDQRPYGDFTPGRYAWLLADILPVDPPVPFKGGRSLSKEWEPVAAGQPEA